MKSAVLVLLGMLIVLSLLPIGYLIKTTKNQQKQLDLHEKRLSFNNAIKFHDKEYYVYGLQGAGYIRGKYPVYTPIYMKDIDMLKAVDDQVKDMIEHMDQEAKKHS